MNKNQNVDSGKHSDDINIAVSALVNEIICGTVSATSSLEDSATSSNNTEEHLPYNNAPSFSDSVVVDLLRQSQSKEPTSTYEIYRAIQRFHESRSDVNLRFMQNRPAVIISDPISVPPSYSTVIKQGQPSLNIRRDLSSLDYPLRTTEARIPPPSYAEIHGTWSRDVSIASCKL